MSGGTQDAPYREVPLYRRDGTIRASVLVDEVDYERFGRHRWSANGRGYVSIFIQGVGRRGPGVKGPGHYITLHRAIMGLTKGDGVVVDHINGNTLDNRRANLRTGTQTQNLQNRGYGYGRSKHRGVGWDASRGKWVASAKLPGMRASKFLGRFTSEEEAARVSAAFRAEHMPGSKDARLSRAGKTQPHR